MKKSNLSFCEFCDEFSEQYKNNFSYDGKRVLYDYLEDREQETGEEYDLDTVALCCEFTEYENLAECQKDYPDIESIEDLEEKTLVIRINSDTDKSFIIAQF